LKFIASQQQFGNPGASDRDHSMYRGLRMYVDNL